MDRESVVLNEMLRFGSEGEVPALESEVGAEFVASRVERIRKTEADRDILPFPGRNGDGKLLRPVCAGEGETTFDHAVAPGVVQQDAAFFQQIARIVDVALFRKVAGFPSEEGAERLVPPQNRLSNPGRGSGMVKGGIEVSVVQFSIELQDGGLDPVRHDARPFQIPIAVRHGDRFCRTREPLTVMIP